MPTHQSILYRYLETLGTTRLGYEDLSMLKQVGTNSIRMCEVVTRYFQHDAPGVN
jgi:hypothetical protein